MQCWRLNLGSHACQAHAGSLAHSPPLYLMNPCKKSYHLLINLFLNLTWCYLCHFFFFTSIACSVLELSWAGMFNLLVGGEDVLKDFEVLGKLRKPGFSETY